MTFRTAVGDYSRSGCANPPRSAQHLDGLADPERCGATAWVTVGWYHAYGEIAETCSTSRSVVHNQRSKSQLAAAARHRVGMTLVQDVRELRPGGVLTRRAALEAGMTPSDIKRMLRAGRWQAMHRGVYFADAGLPTPLERARAAVLAVGDGVASHDTAARVHGIVVVRHSMTEHLTVDRKLRRPHRPQLRMHTSGLTPRQQCTLGGVPLTTAERTAYDLLRDADPLTGIYACEDALRRGLVRPASLREMVEDPSSLGGHWSTARRRFFSIEPQSESPLETAGRLLLIGAGLPAPMVQIRVCDPATGDVLFRIDLGYEPQRIGIELDGYGVHGAPDAIMADRRRQNALQVLGWMLLRFTWHDVMHRRGYVVDVVRRALAAAA